MGYREQFEDFFKNNTSELCKRCRIKVYFTKNNIIFDNNLDGILKSTMKGGADRKHWYGKGLAQLRKDVPVLRLRTSDKNMTPEEAVQRCK